MNRPLTPGAVKYPAFGDAHLHLAALGRQSRELKLHGLGYSAALAAVANSAKKKDTQGGWITGHGWDQNLWTLPPNEQAQGWPLAAALDAVAKDRPVCLRRIDGHALWANGKAMRAAGLDPARPAPAAPADGEIITDDAGRPCGVFVDAAMKRITSALPRRTPDDAHSALLAGQMRMLAAGALRVHDMDVDDLTLAAYERQAAQNLLALDFTVYLGADSAGAEMAFKTGSRRISPRLRIAGLKLYADGALGSRGAHLCAPYHDAPRTRGLALWKDEALRALLRRAADAGLQIAAHAIGDAACRQLLDAFEKFGAAPRELRWRIEHAQIVAPIDRDRMAALGLIASIQPGHAVADAAWAGARLGSERMNSAYAWRSLAAAGIALAGGSDAPIDDERPLWQFHAAVRRRGFDGRPPEGFLNDESLMPAAALALISGGVAFAGGEAAAPGDFTLLDRDILEHPDAAAEAKVLGVYRDGKQIIASEAPAHPG